MRTRVGSLYLRVATLHVFLIGVGGIALGQEASDTSEVSPATPPQLSIGVYQTDKSLTAPLEVYVTLTNLNPHSYDIQRVQLMIPQSMKSIRGDLCLNLIVGCDREDSDSTDPGKFQPLSAHSQRFYQVPIRRVHQSFFSWLLNQHTFLFLPGTYTIRCVVEYKAKETYGSIQEEIPIDLEPPLGSLLRGGIVGSLLLAIFLPIYRFSRHEPPAPWQPENPMLRMPLTFIQISISGSVVSVIAILLLQRLGDLDLPVTIDVKDWIGGVIIGLFSYQIGDTLYGRFIGGSPPSAK